MHIYIRDNYLEISGKTFGSVTRQFENDFEVMKFGLQSRQLFLPWRHQLVIDFDEMRQQLAQLLALHSLHQRSWNEPIQSVLPPFMKSVTQLHSLLLLQHCALNKQIKKSDIDFFFLFF